MRITTEQKLHSKPARVEAKVYVDQHGKFRWRIRSTLSNGQIISDSGQGYYNKRDAVRSLSLTLGGPVELLFRTVGKNGTYEQGYVYRYREDAQVERIFVEYVKERSPR